MRPAAGPAAFAIHAMKVNPFNDPIALAHTRLHLARNGTLTAFDAAAASDDPFVRDAHTAFRELVLRPGFSCIGAKAAFNDNAYGLAVYPELAAPESTAGLCRDLCHFTHTDLIRDSEYATFVAVFRTPVDVDETTFEELLWRQLSLLHAADAQYFSWDKTVSADTDDSHFSFSFAGRAFYVIGLHSRSSRLARQFAWPTLVFNPHEQFERLRSDGKWKRMQNAIRAREVVLQGSINPTLSDFGEKSEARQYSGRKVSEEWVPPVGKCPFH